MKYLLIAFFGLLLGVAAGAVSIYYNPLTDTSGPALRDAQHTFAYATPGGDSLLLTHGGRSSLPRHPSDAPELWESTISELTLEVVRLKDAAGQQTAFATRTSLPSEQTEWLTKGAIMSDYWLVTVPGEGSFFVHSESNLAPLLKQVIVPVRYLGQPWSGPVDFAPTVGPALDQHAQVSGATGRFAALQGRAVESLRLEKFSAARGTEALQRRLHVEFYAPSEEAVAEAELEAER